MIRVKVEFAGIQELTTQVNGKRVALNKAFTATIPADGKKQAHTVDVPLATQAEMATLLKDGSPVLEEVGSEQKQESPVK